MIEKTDEFKQLVELLKEYQNLCENEIVAKLTTEDNKVFEFSKNKLKKVGK